MHTAYTSRDIIERLALEHPEAKFETFNTCATLTLDDVVWRAPVGGA